MNRDTMRAVVLTGEDAYGVETVPMPQPGYGEVLLRVKSVAICGSDPKLFLGLNRPVMPPSYPFIAGHEFSGQVVAVGDGVTQWRAGDRVAGEGHLGCGHCENCRTGLYNLCRNYGKADQGHKHYGILNQGAYAEYAVYNAKSLSLLPDNVSFDEAALLDTATTAFNGVRLVGIAPGGTSLIVGDGPIGLFAAQFSKAMGSRQTIVVGCGARLQKAREIAADVVIDFTREDVVEAVGKVTGGRGADQVFECVGMEQTVNQSIHCVKRGGKVVLIGMPVEDHMNLPVKKIILDQITVVGSRASSNAFPTVLGMISSGVIDAKTLISHRFPMDEIKPAMDVFHHKKDGSIKVVIHP